MHDIEMENTEKYEVCICFLIQRGFYMDNYKAYIMFRYVKTRTMQPLSFKWIVQTTTTSLMHICQLCININYTLCNELRRVNVFSPSVSPVFFVSATPLIPLNRMFWNFVVIHVKDIMCRYAFLFQFFPGSYATFELFSKWNITLKQFVLCN